MNNFQEDLEKKADEVQSKLDEMRPEVNFEWQQGVCRRQNNGLYNKDLVTYHGQMSFDECKYRCSSLLDCAAFSHKMDATGTDANKNHCITFGDDQTSSYYGDG